MKYDWRNLMTENYNVLSQFTYRSKYWYDEAGSRVRKLVQRWQPGGGIEGGDGNVGGPGEGGDAGGSWVTVRNTYYVRDAGGKEIALYSGTNLEEWNLFGNDQVGFIDSTGKRSFYLKDHLGTTRVVLDSNNVIIAANDYDAWGYPLENRSYSAGSFVGKYQFTGKERDKESGPGDNDGYDYFGARYYDSRIANWTSVDPLFEKHIQWTPYNYVLRNPLILYDPDGMQVSVNDRPMQTQKETGGGIYISPETWEKIGQTIGTGLLIENALTEEESHKAETDITGNETDKNEDSNKEKEPEKSKKDNKKNDKEGSKRSINANELIMNLISGSLKTSASYHTGLEKETLLSILKKSKDKSDPDRKKAQQMKKLFDQSERLREKQKK